MWGREGDESGAGFLDLGSCGSCKFRNRCEWDLRGGGEEKSGEGSGGGSNAAERQRQVENQKGTVMFSNSSFKNVWKTKPNQ